MTSDRDEIIAHQVSISCGTALTTDKPWLCDYAWGFIDGIAITLNADSLLKQRIHACSAILRKGSFDGLEDPALLDKF